VDFEYHRAYSVAEAIDLFARLRAEAKAPLFYSGGTEILTLMREQTQYIGTKAVIDLKSVPECRHNGFDDDNNLVIGSCVTLAEIEEMTAFPLFGQNCSRIADHTSREKITVGGNICGRIIYREAVLPLLLTDCDVLIADDTGVRRKP